MLKKQSKKMHSHLKYLFGIKKRHKDEISSPLLEFIDKPTARKLRLVNKTLNKKYNDYYNSYLFLLTSLVYELMRHEWQHPQCQQLRQQLLNNTQTPQQVKDMLQQNNARALSDYLFTIETRHGDYFGENLSDDSDSEAEDDFQDQEFLHKESALQQAVSLRNKIAVNMLDSLIKGILAAEKLKHEFYIACCQNNFGYKQMPINLKNDIKKFKELFANPNKKIQPTCFIMKDLYYAYNATINGINISGKSITCKKNSKKATRRALKNLLADPEFSQCLIVIPSLNNVDINVIFDLFKKIISNLMNIELAVLKNEGKGFLDLIPTQNLPYGTKEKLSQWVQALHKLNINQYQQQLKKQKLDFVIPLCRGVTYNTSLWNKPSRNAHIKSMEVGKKQYSSATFNSANVNLTQQQNFNKPLNQQEIKELDNYGANLRALMQKLKSIGPITYDGTKFNNVNDLIQKKYSCKYDEFNTVIESIKNCLRKQKQLTEDEINLLNGKNIFISTGAAKHASRYGYGIKPYKGHENERLRPRWNKNGRAERNKSGKLYAILYSARDFKWDVFNHVPHLVNNGNIKVPSIILAEDEVSFYGFLDANCVVKTYVAKYLSFHRNYKKIFLLRYGLDEQDFKAFQNGILKTKPHTVGRRYIKRILGNWISKHTALKMYSELIDAATKQGKILVFLTKEGKFSFKPMSPTNRKKK